MKDLSLRPVYRGIVLLVDDEHLVLNALRRRLVAAGYRVRCFTDPHEVFKAIVEYNIEFDLILTDWELGDTKEGWNGTTLLAELRLAGVTQPMILWSGNDDVRLITPDNNFGPDLVMNKGEIGKIEERIVSLLAK